MSSRQDYSEQSARAFFKDFYDTPGTEVDGDEDEQEPDVLTQYPAFSMSEAGEGPSEPYWPTGPRYGSDDENSTGPAPFPVSGSAATQISKGNEGGVTHIPEEACAAGKDRIRFTNMSAETKYTNQLLLDQWMNDRWLSYQKSDIEPAMATGKVSKKARASKSRKSRYKAKLREEVERYLKTSKGLIGPDDVASIEVPNWPDWLSKRLRKAGSDPEEAERTRFLGECILSIEDRDQRSANADKKMLNNLRRRRFACVPDVIASAIDRQPTVSDVVERYWSLESERKRTGYKDAWSTEEAK